MYRHPCSLLHWHCSLRSSRQAATAACSCLVSQCHCFHHTSHQGTCAVLFWPLAVNYQCTTPEPTCQERCAMCTSNATVEPIPARWSMPMPVHVLSMASGVACQHVAALLGQRQLLPAHHSSTFSPRVAHCCSCQSTMSWWSALTSSHWVTFSGSTGRVLSIWSTSTEPHALLMRSAPSVASLSCSNCA